MFPGWTDDDAADDESSWDDDDDFDSGELDADRDDSTIPCPYCRREIHEDTPRCPYCERYLSDEDAPPARKPWWIVVGVIVCLVLVYCWVVR